MSLILNFSAENAKSTYRELNITLAYVKPFWGI